MSSKVYSIGIDLSKLQDALKISEKIKKNIDSDGKDKKKSMFGDLNKSNNQLKEQNKQLSITGQKLKLIRLTLSKLNLGSLGLGALGGLALGGISALGGLALGGIVGSLSNIKGSLRDDLQARNNRLTFGENKALGYTDKMIGLNEGTLINSISGLNKALDDFSQWGNFASLGLNASELKKKNPTEALFEVLDAMKTSDLPKYMKRNIIDKIGIPFDDFQFVLEEGTGELRKFFKQGMGLYGKQGANVLKSGERALINFQNALKKLSLSIANKTVPVFTKALNVATPYILKFADAMGRLLGKILTKSNIDKVFNFIDLIINKSSKLFKDINPFKGLGTSYLNYVNKVLEISGKAQKDFLDKMKDIWVELQPDIKQFISWFKDDIYPELTNLVGIMRTLQLNSMRKLIEVFYDGYKILKPVMKPLGNLFKTLLRQLNNILKSYNDMINNLDVNKILAPLNAISGVGEWWRNFKDGSINVWQYIKDAFINSWKGTKDIVKNVWTSIKEGFLVMITGLIDMINGILNNKVVSTLTGGASIKAGWGYDEQGNFGKRTYDSKGNYKVTKINDGVITKDGQVVKTSPQDYIFAMKQPQQLSTAGAGNYTININANVRNDSDVAKIKNELHRLITQLNAKR